MFGVNETPTRNIHPGPEAISRGALERSSDLSKPIKSLTTIPCNLEVEKEAIDTVRIKKEDRDKIVFTRISVGLIESVVIRLSWY